jgi:hypothetical protein
LPLAINKAALKIYFDEWVERERLSGKYMEVPA